MVCTVHLYTCTHTRARHDSAGTTTKAVRASSVRTRCQVSSQAPKGAEGGEAKSSSQKSPVRSPRTRKGGQGGSAGSKSQLRSYKFSTSSALGCSCSLALYCMIGLCVFGPNSTSAQSYYYSSSAGGGAEWYFIGVGIVFGLAVLVGLCAAGCGGGVSRRRPVLL